MLNFSLLLMSSSFIGICLLFLKSTHLLSLLITLEYVFLLIFALAIIMASQENWEILNSSVFLATAASESAVALSVYVLMTRFYSKDYVINFFNLKM